MQSSPLSAQAISVEPEKLVQQMTLAEKIGQMTQVEKGSLSGADVIAYAIGSVLSGGGGNPTPNTPAHWAAMVREFQEAAQQTRLRIPLIYGSDAVHGHSNVVGTVLFPHNIALGATRDAKLVERIARATAREMMATNVHFNFAPAISVPQDIRWGRTYEGFGQDTALVAEMGTAYVHGLQDGDPRTLASIKHFVADGGTKWGTSLTFEWLAGLSQAPGDSYKIDQGDSQLDEAELRAIHLAPYKAAIEAGAQNVMVSFSSWNGTKMHAHHYLITEVLKGELGFNGFVISDWMAVNQIDKDYSRAIITAINAGIDMVMVPYDYKEFIELLTAAVQAGQVPMSRIDDAVTRILRVKAWLGVFDQPFGREDLLPSIGSAEHRAIAREAVQKSLVLLKNERQTLPLPKDSYVRIAGRGVDDIGMQCGGWSVSWQGDLGATTMGTSILSGIRQVAGTVDVEYDANAHFDSEIAPYGIVVIGETPYSEGIGDNGTLTLTEEDAAVVRRMRAACDRLIVVLLCGRPLLVSEEIGLADAFVVAWQPGTEAQGVADVLFGDVPFTGKLPHDWPRSIDQVPLKALKAHPDGPLFPFGYGL
ncbi:MAG: glycoside hydrolase family 3 N-terminal domain-containing protein [Anaerolineae bacterium]